MDFARGNFIDNRWIKPTGPAAVRSINPATVDDVVLEAPTDPGHAALAVSAARRAWPAWASLAPEERMAALRRFSRELAGRTEALARAVSMEMGKTIREARLEATSLTHRIDLVADQQLPAVKSWTAPGVAGECRYHPLGVMVVLGPFNFPLHLCHAHIIPALATGNTVVVKPSERTPLAFQRYMEAWAAAGLPPILHMTQGGPDVGRALLACPEVRGVALTGSWRTGQAISRAMLDRPEVLLALEMGGQNMAIVLEDADLDQALEGVLLGGYLTTGQRCTATARVLVQKSIAPAFIDRLVKAAARLSLGDPMSDVFMGPMGSVGERDRIEALCRAGREAGAELLLAPEIREGGAWRGPSIHLIGKDHDSDYTREEIFGPDLAVTIVDDLDDAIGVVRSSAYGLSVSLFSARRAAFEAVYLHTHVGCVNWNRATHHASGALPFGGVGRSGNYRAAGSDAVRFATYPVQVQWNEPGVLENDGFVRQALAAADPLSALEAGHRIEEALEPYGLYPEIDVTGASGVVRLPLSELDHPTPLSRALLEQLRARGVQAELTETALRIALSPGDKPAQRLARALSDGLHAIRTLAPRRLLARRPAGAHVPAGDPRSLPRSQAFMRRLLGGDLVSGETPPVIDLLRSQGRYLASVDAEPLVLVDPASQEATHAAGLNAPAVLEALVQGRFGALPIDGGASDAPDVQRLGAVLRQAAGNHPYVRLSGSGAEANEIALATCAAKRPGRRAIVAFQGASHGQTMLALHATWDPDTRVGFELEGFESRWIDLPVWSDPSGAAPEPGGWLTQWSRPATERRTPTAAPDDPQLAAEIRALSDVEAALADDQAVAVIAEPMQTDGGRRATPRFFRALRALTELHGVPLVIDEGQSGSGPGGPFFRHQQYELPSPPDVITCAKDAQVGVTLSRWPIPVRCDVQAASAARGLIYAELLREAEPSREAMVERTDVAPAWPQAWDKLGPAYRFQRVGPAEWPSVRAAYEALHEGVLPPPLRGDFDRFSALMSEPDAICLVVLHGAPAPTKPAVGKPTTNQATLVGACIGFPLEHVAELDGPRLDRSLGRGDTFFSADLTVLAEHRGQGVGRALAEAQIAAAMGVRRADGTPRFAFLTGVHHGAHALGRHLYTELGAWAVARQGDAEYFRICLTWPRLPSPALVRPGAPSGVLDLEQGLERRLGDPRGPGMEELREHLAEGRLNGAIVNKLSLGAFVTPAVVRAHEWLRLQSPKGMQHMLLSSGRAEAFDKTLRALKLHRRAARDVLSLGPVRAGMSTAAARSASLTDKDDLNWFGWPSLPDPTREPERALTELKRQILERGSEHILAVVTEPVYLATGRAVPESFWAPLRELCDQLDAPLVLLESATGGYRSARGMWRADTLPIQADALVFNPGGQLGLAFVCDRYDVGDEAPLISVLDGDELALTRLMWELRAARHLPIAQRATELRRALQPLGEVQGEGLFLAVEHPQAEVIARRLLERGIKVGSGASEERALRFIPALNLTSDEVTRLGTAIREVLG